jgi:type IV pilus assembly protein PilQ
MNRSTAFHHLRSALGLALACLAAMFVMQGAQAADAPASANSLQSIDVQTIGGKQVQLTLHMTGPAPEPMSFTIDKPARISLDLPGVSLAMPSHRIDVASAGVDTVLAAEASGRTRIVLNLDALQPYQTRVSGNDLIVTVGAGPAAEAAAASAPAASGDTVA